MAVNDLLMQIKIAVTGDNGAAIRKLEEQLRKLQSTANQLQNVKLAGLTADLANLRSALTASKTLNLGNLPTDMARFKAELLSANTASAGFRSTIRGLNDDSQRIRQLDISPLRNQIQDINQGLALTKLTKLTPLQNSFRAASNDVLATQVKIRDLQETIKSLPKSSPLRAIEKINLKTAITDLNNYKNVVDKSRIAINDETTSLANNTLQKKQQISGLQQQINASNQLILANQKQIVQERANLLAEERKATSAKNNVGLTQAQIKAEQEASRIRQNTIRNTINTKEQEITAARKTIASNNEQIISTKALLAQQKSLNKVSSIAGLGAASSALKDFGKSLGFVFGPQMAGFAAAGTIIGLTDSFISANKQVEQLVRGLNAISGGQGRAEFQYLVDVSNKLGVSIGESAHSFLQLEATTAGTAIEGAKTKQIFESFSRALNVTGADAVTFNRAFRAVSQSLSKGQLYAEELKGQLAEALPGAIQVFAKAIDVTPKKFLAMVKAGQFAGQTLYDLYGLVALQLDKTFKVGSEKDFTFVQKANLAKNAFVGLSVELGKTGIWKALSDGMLYLRDTIVDATKEVNNLSAIFQSTFRQNAAVVADISKALNEALGTEVSFDNVEFNFGGLVRNFRFFFQMLPDVVRQEMQPLEDAFAEFDIAKAFIDFLPNVRAAVEIIAAAIGKLSTDTFRSPYEVPLKNTKKQIDDIKNEIATIKMPNVTSQEGLRISIAPETNDEIKRIELLKTKLADLEQLQKEMTASALEYYGRQSEINKGFDLNPNTLKEFGQVAAAIKSLEQSASQLKSEGTNIFGTWKSAEAERSFNAIQVAIGNLNRRKASIGLELNEQQAQSVIQQTRTFSEMIDDILNKRNATTATRKLNQEQIRMEGVLQKYADYAAGRARDNQKSAEETIAVKEKDIVITKNQLAYEKKILDIKQEQRDAQVGFAKARYNEWVKTGSLTQESADFLTKSAEDTSALKSIRDAKDAVEAYNNEKNKGADANDEELKLLRSNALELLKLGSEKARQVANEYEYNKLVEERKRLLAEEKTAANEGADAVYKAKIKAENPKAESDAAQKSLQDEASKTPITYRAIIKPELDSSLPAQQSGLMFSSLRQEYQQTQQVFDNKLRVTVDDAQVNEALQSLTLYQSKIQDIKTRLLPNGQTEIIVTPKINESALQQGFQFIKTAAVQASPTVTVKPVVDATAVAEVKKTSEEVKKDILSIIDKDGKKVNFIVVANGVKKTDEEMKRLSAQKEIPVTAFTDQKSLDDAKKKFDETGNYIKDGLRGATTIAPQGIQNTLDTAFGKDKYKLEIVPTLTGGVTEDGWIKNNEIKRNLIITPVAGATAEADAMIQSQIQGVKSGYEGAWQKLRELDSANQKALEETPLKKLAEIDPTKALEQDAALVSQLSQTVTKYVDVFYRTAGSGEATAPVTAATGGYLSGYGGGDRIHALLEAGEFILRKEAVRKLGLSNVFALNNLNIPKPSRSVDKMSIPSFSSGGYVGGSNIININVPGSKSIQVSGSRESAMALANLLTRVGRAA